VHTSMLYFYGMLVLLGHKILPRLKLAVRAC
jgi:hypothetical protein